jgi:hypothetical protein
MSITTILLNRLEVMKNSDVMFNFSNVMDSLCFPSFFEGFDPTKINSHALIASLMEDNRQAELLGIDPEPSQRSLELAGLDRKKFLQMSERAAANFNPHSARGRANARKLKQASNFDGTVLGDIKNHMINLSSELRRSKVTKLAKEWDVELNLFKCHTCGTQQKDLSAKLLRCGACGEAYYCSKVCQQSHWKTHKLTCRKLNQ